MCFKRQYCDNFHNYQTITNKYNKNVEELECLFFEMTRIYYILVRLL